MMSDVGIDIFQLRIRLKILRNKLGSKMFESEHMMKNLIGDMILPKIWEYNYYHETRSKTEVILF